MAIGQPVKFKTVEELQAKIDEYFDYCDNKTKEEWSEKKGSMILPNPEPYTMGGLARYIGLSRQGLINYEKKDEFGDIVTAARSRVEYDLERRLVDKESFTIGIIFNLKNNFKDWKDKTDVEHSGGVTVTFDPSLKQDE